MDPLVALRGMLLLLQLAINRSPLWLPTYQTGHTRIGVNLLLSRGVSPWT